VGSETPTPRQRLTFLLRASSLALAAAAQILAPAATASDWVPVGPSGGAVRALVQDPATGALFAGTYAGGATWALKSAGITNRSTLCIVRDAASRMLYACTGDGVFRSTDGGEKWVRQHSGLSTRVIALALDPADPTTLHARDAHWVYTSRDGGVTWKKSDADLDSSGTNNSVFALTTAPGMPLARVQTVVADAKGTTLWLGTEGEGVWRSTDGGATWTESRAGMGAVNVQALHADAASPGTLYAAAWGKGVFRSTDAGQSWSLVGGPPPHPDVIALALDASGPGRVLVGTGGASVRMGVNDPLPMPRVLHTGRRNRSKPPFKLRQRRASILLNWTPAREGEYPPYRLLHTQPRALRMTIRYMDAAIRGSPSVGTTGIA